MGRRRSAGRRRCRMKPARQTRLDVARLQLPGKLAVVVVTRRPAAMIEDDGLDAGGAGALETARIAPRSRSPRRSWRRGGRRRIASMSACRLLPRPEIRTPRRRFTARFDVGHGRRLAGDDLADDAGVAAAARRQLADERLGLIARDDDDQPDAHVERPHHVVDRHVARWSAASGRAAARPRLTHRSPRRCRAAGCAEGCR